MSSATDKEVAFFTCSCEEGLLKVDCYEWHFTTGMKEKEFGFNFAVPCFSRFRDRLMMMWDMLNGKQSHYLTLKQEDAEKLGQWLLKEIKEE
jgi:hypothetical protein